MKEQILPPLPIVGKLKLSSRDGKSLSSISVTKACSTKILDPFFQECFFEFKKFLSGASQDINLPLDFQDISPFQVKVLKAMRKIPYAKVASYKDLAQQLDSKAYQAIGSACGKNPFMLIYPCHRIVGTHNIGGFAHGLKMKRALLELESSLPSL